MTASSVANTVHSRSYSILIEGSYGEEVKYLQTLLNKFYCEFNCNHPLIIDGHFGSQTKARVKLFQTDCFLIVDGIVGPETWSFLEAIVSVIPTNRPTLLRGSKGNEVKYLQARLNEFYRIATDSVYHETRIVVDGDFGPKTEERVKQFQIFLGLVVDGIVGDQTWFKLALSLGHV